MQEIITYTLVAVAVLFLIKKYIFPSKNHKNCNSDCGCR
ncbi:FeoB-associated Cys-rich membrane protein [Polaribacter aquimarinus]|uniref:FeoB-associated Cys-rich membrane protein n=1 Tax=Polaribacter aquimarinus TaxID=2100726 RepID=A0A2U2JBP1_9FLAO|nr:FeoB-associated Cys-rich membrane protein [Polaribacter aquimarinus]